MRPLYATMVDLMILHPIGSSIRRYSTEYIVVGYGTDSDGDGAVVALSPLGTPMGMCYSITSEVWVSAVGPVIGTIRVD